MERLYRVLDRSPIAGYSPRIFMRGVHAAYSRPAQRPCRPPSTWGSTRRAGLRQVSQTLDSTDRKRRDCDSRSTSEVCMKLSAPIFILKQQAKALSRSEKIPLHAALDRIANREGFAAWSLLAAKW